MQRDRDPAPLVAQPRELDLRHVGAQVAQQLGRLGPLHQQPQVEHPDSLERSPRFGQAPARALALASRARIDRVARYLVRRVASEPGTMDVLVRAIHDEEDDARVAWMVEELDAAVRDERNLATPDGWSELYTRLAHGDEALRETALWLAVTFGDGTAFPDLRTVVLDAGMDLGQRERALEALMRGNDAGSVPMLHRLLDDQDLRGRALRALGEFDDVSTAREILARYGSYDVEQRRDALNTLSTRAAYALELLDAVGDGTVDRGDLGAFVLRNLDNLEDERVTAGLREHWGVVRETAQAAEERVAQLLADLTPAALAAADLPRGRLLFSKNCQQCHTLFDEGGTLGPDLTGSNRADLRYLLTTVIDPNAVIGRDYQATNVWLTDGRVVSGVEKRRSDTSITLQTENETLVVPMDDVDDVQLSELSTMPEGLLDHLQPDEVRDLVAYAGAPGQTTLRAAPENVGRFFDGESLAGWTGDGALWSVEAGEIVGRSDGIPRNAFLRSHLDLGDFRLRLEVRLVNDEGNSGIQFRSRDHGDGSVHGYQADVGPGWWGKLYEEHGREVLGEGDGASAVRRGEWNTYEIVAVGQRVRLTLNDTVTVELDDPGGARRGYVALQLHSGGPTEVRFRNFELTLDPEGEFPSNPR